MCYVLTSDFPLFHGICCNMTNSKSKNYWVSREKETWVLWYFFKGVAFFLHLLDFLLSNKKNCFLIRYELI